MAVPRSISLLGHTHVSFSKPIVPANILIEAVATGVKLNKGSAYAFQIDGLITLTSEGSFNGNAIVIENASDVEVFSSNALHREADLLWSNCPTFPHH
jgi:hypothetical protein